MTLFAFAADRRCCWAAAALDRYCLDPCPQLRLIDGLDTDGRTPYRYTDPTAYYASSVNYLLIYITLHYLNERKGHALSVMASHCLELYKAIELYKA